MQPINETAGNEVRRSCRHQCYLLHAFGFKDITMRSLNWNVSDLDHLNLANICHPNLLVIPGWKRLQRQSWARSILFELLKKRFSGDSFLSASWFKRVSFRLCMHVYVWFYFSDSCNGESLGSQAKAPESRGLSMPRPRHLSCRATVCHPECCKRARII